MEGCVHLLCNSNVLDGRCFVDVPFPGTRAWTGTIIAYVLGMLFWFGRVILAMLVVNLLMNLGLKYAIVTGVLLFFASTTM
jgi:uncharacterized membrane protein